MAATLSVAQRVARTEAEGPGERYALWLQGCPMRCLGCCNPEMLPFEGGTPITVAALLEEIERARPIEGITLLGGEPFAQAAAAAELCEAVRARALTVMIFTGYTLAEIRGSSDPAAGRLLRSCDLLVDGRYERGDPEPRRRWIGSANQVMHFLSDRHDPSEPRFTAPNSVELRLSAGELAVNGFPVSGLRKLGRA
jgi:anaerobic ribonucleoside-triphosphate reductase activating protein